MILSDALRKKPVPGEENAQSAIYMSSRKFVK